jgi:hypothetical protein
MSDWSDPVTFNVLDSVPERPTLIYPIDGVNLCVHENLSFEWNAVAGADTYFIWIGDSEGNVITHPFSATQAGCAGGTGTCTAAPAEVPASGDCRWWIRASNTAGQSPWSERGEFVNSSGPDAPPLVSPAGGVELQPGSTPHVWEAVSGSTWYLLWVSEADAGRVYRAWHTDEEAGCPDGTGECSWNINLGEGRYTWWVQSWNRCGDTWSSASSYRLCQDCTLPPPVLRSPQGDITDTTPTYRWSPSGDSSWYMLWINDAGGNIFNRWFRASDCGCEAGDSECAVTPDLTLSAGDHSWWVRPWNSNGNGPWSESLNFTVTGQ